MADADELGDVFGDAWLILLLADGDESMDGPAVRRRLAQRLMEAAGRGEADPQRLKRHALTGVLGPDSIFVAGMRGRHVKASELLSTGEAPLRLAAGGSHRQALDG